MSSLSEDMGKKQKFGLTDPSPSATFRPICRSFCSVGFCNTTSVTVPTASKLRGYKWVEWDIIKKPKYAELARDHEELSSRIRARFRRSSVAWEKRYSILCFFASAWLWLFKSVCLELVKVDLDFKLNSLPVLFWKTKGLYTCTLNAPPESGNRLPCLLVLSV